MPTLRQPPRDAGSNPDKLYQHLRGVHDDMTEMKAAIDRLTSATAPITAVDAPLTDAQLAQARHALSANGAHPLPLTGLVGTTATPQPAAPIVANDIADLNARFPAHNYPIPTLAIAVVSHLLYYVAADAHGVHTWTAV